MIEFKILVKHGNHTNGEVAGDTTADLEKSRDVILVLEDGS